MNITNLYDLVAFLMIIFLSVSAGYTRGQSESWKDWLNGFFE